MGVLRRVGVSPPDLTGERGVGEGLGGEIEIDVGLVETGLVGVSAHSDPTASRAASTPWAGDPASCPSWAGKGRPTIRSSVMALPALVELADDPRDEARIGSGHIGLFLIGMQGATAEVDATAEGRLTGGAVCWIPPDT
jgi:hypothetical protein